MICRVFIKVSMCMRGKLPVLMYPEVRDIMKKLRSFFPICKACEMQEPVARTESLLEAVLVGGRQYPVLLKALEEAKERLDFDDAVDLYVVSSPGANAGSFRLPGEPAQIKLNGALIGLLGLLDPANENLALVVLLHELTHLLFDQSRYKTAMRVYATFLDDGTKARAARSQQAMGAFQKYLVAMELTADAVMLRALTKKLGLEEAKKTTRTVFARMASGVDSVDGDAYYAQLQECDLNVVESLLAAAETHPPLGVRLHLLLHGEDKSLLHETMHAWRSATKPEGGRPAAPGPAAPEPAPPQRAARVALSA
jgi:hypothetical protein